MQTPLDRLGFSRTATAAATLFVLLAPIFAWAQGADAPVADSCALPPFLQAVLPDVEPPRVLDRRVARALNEAVAALNDARYADARASVGELDFDRLTRYELGMAEAVLYRIANAEQNYGEAREHLVNSIQSCGLTPEGVADARNAIERIDERLAAPP